MSATPGKVPIFPFDRDLFRSCDCKSRRSHDPKTLPRLPASETLKGPGGAGTKRLRHKVKIIFFVFLQNFRSFLFI
ncbi:unnamed protein product [Staurois parvus]|uniref:Uncharacterized protein n=1 Tax=Staurois parvus TaxID=386267 RepID=A0ABN9G4M6_9NEOB|nr:unnamed protein product [Staurois parvus]